MPHIIIRKYPCFIVYTKASPEKPPSVTPELRVLVQPAKPASLNALLREELPKTCVSFTHKVFTTFCAPFSNRISHFKILAMLLVYVLCLLLRQAQGSLAFSVVCK